MGAETPWWKTAKTARQGFAMGALWAVLGLGHLLSELVGRTRTWHLVLSAGMLALAGAYLVTAVALRRRERSHAETTPAKDLNGGGWRREFAKSLAEVLAFIWDRWPG